MLLSILRSVDDGLEVYGKIKLATRQCRVIRPTDLQDYIFGDFELRPCETLARRLPDLRPCLLGLARYEASSESA